ncbi:MAG: prepilin-type N-terminal cleavage/methylation domain-containing protein [bacterium]|nr:prepilin-type N-terminal cleavage/methylation domain-containing protein [bacterium]MDD5354229.1 prepilin-type N-terminal cleavage/methylation domain-containing protein [bacterium]MDD5757137.1 prepilin-type N-terminal cleavage/methylation domain-containing protein [bacterium]
MRKKNQGFTIIEIIFALALLAVGLAEVVIIMGEGQSHSKLAKMNTIALGLAKEQMESIRNLPYAGVNPVPATAYAVPYLDYSYQVFVTSVGSLPGQIKDVVVRVSYTASKGITNSINLETYVANY